MISKEGSSGKYKARPKIRKRQLRLHITSEITPRNRSRGKFVERRLSRKIVERVAKS